MYQLLFEECYILAMFFINKFKIITICETCVNVVMENAWTF